MATLRVFIIEPTASMRESLGIFIRDLGHEVISCTEPNLCPFYSSSNCECPQEHSCGDVLIVGQHLPLTGGLDFIERRIAGSCKGLVNNTALICAPWSAPEQARAKELGCHCFETPLDLDELARWLADIDDRTPEHRQLACLDSFQTPG